MTSTEVIVNEASRILTERGIQTYRYHELNNFQALQIVAASKEPVMLEWVQNDASVRFPDKESAQHWFTVKERILYGLKRDIALTALAWFSPKPHPNPQITAEYTYAIRLYEGMRGQGLARAVMAVTHEAFYEASGYKGPTWLSVNAKNMDARRLYEKFGYEGTDQLDERIIMIRPGVSGDF